MLRDDELPPLPVSLYVFEVGGHAFDADQMREYASAVERAAYKRAAQQCKIVGHNMEEYQRYFDACADCADAIRSLIQENNDAAR